MAKILLVEDDNNLREIYQARLQAEGYTIVSARDGEEALVVAKAEKPDLIIADVMMPKISGFEMLDIVRNTDTLKGVKVIMLTALGQSEDQKRADKLGADRYLVKSQVTLEDIVKAAQELIGETSGPAPVGTSTPTTPQGAPAPETTATSPAPAAASAAPATPEPASPPDTAPAPTPAAEPKAAATDAQATNKAETAKEEAAEAEAKIEDFVAGATTEPTAPSPAPATPAASSDSAQGVQGQITGSGDSDDKTSDDKLMADAVKALNASAEAEAAPEAPPSKAAKPTPIAVETETPKETPKKEKSSGGSKKVIQPIDSGETKKDIHTLLAEEEAKEKAASASTLNPPVSQTKDESPKPADDPNSIAL